MFIYIYIYPSDLNFWMSSKGSPPPINSCCLVNVSMKKKVHMWHLNKAINIIIINCIIITAALNHSFPYL